MDTFVVKGFTLKFLSLSLSFTYVRALWSWNKKLYRVGKKRHWKILK